jgi:hypothetical protein
VLSKYLYIQRVYAAVRSVSSPSWGRHQVPPAEVPLAEVPLAEALLAEVPLAEAPRVVVPAADEGRSRLAC